jgi:membrane protease YdiL (CAAX protease family)
LMRAPRACYDATPPRPRRAVPEAPMRSVRRSILLLALCVLSAHETARAQEPIEHVWRRLGEEIHARLDAPVLRGPFRPACLGEEPVVISARGEGEGAGPEPLAGSPCRLRIQRVASDGLHDLPGLEDLRLPSGPFPALRRVGSAVLLATAAHLVWVDERRTRQLAAPWAEASRAPQLFGARERAFALGPDGSIWALAPEEAPRQLLPRGAARARFAAAASGERVLWIDELGWLGALELRGSESPRLLYQRLLPCDVEEVRALAAAERDAVIALESGALHWLRDGELWTDGARDGWPAVDALALALRPDGTLEIAERCGWIASVVRLADGDSRAGQRTRWSDGFVSGWTRSLRAVAFPGGWLLQREEALIAVRGGRVVELRSGALPFGLSRSDARPRERPWSALPEWILPRTIRGVSAANGGLWILTGSSIDLFSPGSERLLARHTLGSSARGRAWIDEPFAGFAGGFVAEGRGADGAATTDFYLRAPADRELVHLRVSADGSSEIERFEPGGQFPPPPYGGVAADGAGELLIASRRGLWRRARSATGFARVVASAGDGLAPCDDLAPTADGGCVVLSGGRALAWHPAHGRWEHWAPEQSFRALASAPDGALSATDGHRLFDLSARGAFPWRCPPTPRDVEVRAFARANSPGGPFFVLDRENRVWRSEGSRWHPLQVHESLSEASRFTSTLEGGLYLNLDASLWRLDEAGGPRRALEYRVALARWIDQRGLRNVNFAFGALLLAGLVFAALGGFALPKGPIPMPPRPDRPWSLLDAVVVLALFPLGQLAIDPLLRALDLEAYPVLRASLRFSVPGLAAVVAVIVVLRRRYSRGLDAIGVPRVPTAVAVQQVLVGVLMVVPVTIIAAGISGWLGRVGAPPELLVQELRPLIPIGDAERLGVFLCMAVIAPLVEELLFRGFVQEVCVQRLGAPLGVLLTAVLFVLLHPAGGYAPLFVLALALGCAREATGSLHVCIGLHLAQNFVPALATAVGS